MTTPAGRARRLFLALWPTPAPRAALADWAAQWHWPDAARRTAPQRLHLTLHFLGDVPAERVAALVPALAVPAPRFELAAGHAEVWRQGIAAWQPTGVPAAALALHHTLGAALQRAGLAPEKRPWRPHITLARAARGARPPAQPLRWRWRVSGYALVESVGGAGGGYQVLARYR